MSERTNNPEFGDAEIPEMAKSARTNEYIDGLRDSYEFTMKRISALLETFDNMQEILNIKKSMSRNVTEDYLNEISALSLLSEQVQGDFFDKLDEARRGHS